MHVAVIGCGIFGALSALRLREAGHEVLVLERAPGPLQGASFNNQNRLHLGYHYPRDEETAHQCIRGFRRFCEEFAGCIVSLRECAYFVAEEGSKTPPADYLAFADRLGQACAGEAPRRLDPATFDPGVRGVAVGVSVPEVIYDGAALRELLRRRLEGVQQRYSTEVLGIARHPGGFTLACSHKGEVDLIEAEAVVSCTYAESNRLGAALGHALPTYQYEYTAVPIVAWDQPPVAITVMDGPFLSVLPFGRSGHFLLYHVEYSVLARSVGTQLPAGWRDAETAPALSLEAFHQLREASSAFVPSLAGARKVGCLQGPRVVLSQAEETDARPSLVSEPEPRFVQVFSGKVDHCTWAAEEVVARLAQAV